MAIRCRSGFDGGHSQRFHLEAFAQPGAFLAANVTSGNDGGDSDHDNRVGGPEFVVGGLKAGQVYDFLAYASNPLGRGPTRRLNATTLDLAEKRTAETR